MIDQYNFGLIVVGGKTYKQDSEVRWTGQVLKWWRENSHSVEVEDLERAVGENPETIVIGTGESGLMKVSGKAKELVAEKGIRLIIDRTEAAVKTFNIRKEESEEEEGRPEKIIGLFHLTC